MKIALTEVLSGGRPGATIVHLKHPYFEGQTQCNEYEDGRVAHYGTDLDVDCMTCLVRDSRWSARRPKDFQYGMGDNHDDEH